MGRFARKTTLLVGLALASIVGNSGCELFELIGFPIPGIGESVLVIVNNEAGVQVRVDATFTFSQEDVRLTSRVLQAEGAGASTAILRTIVERIDIRATAIGHSASAQVISNLITPGEVLLEDTLVLNQDYLPGDTIVITIRNPIDDCNANGINDADDLQSGDYEDCDENGLIDACQPDVDNDGVIDACDNCLSIVNPDQTDADNNGLGDVCEIGACDFSLTCVETTLTLCTNQGGSFNGVGTNCGAGNPLPTGACCSGTVCNITTQAICQAGEGTYQGDETICNSTTCATPQGACCLGNGTCVDTTETSCENIEGSYQGDASNCETSDCPQPDGACCLGDGSCSILTESDCLKSGGDYQGNGASCQFAECPIPTGACCYDDGSCSIETAVDCGENDGFYAGDDVSCLDAECPQPTGACCSGGTSCSIKTMDECDDIEGDYLGDDTICETGTCLPNEGACCLTDLSGPYCVELSAGLCNKSGGSFEGEGTTCDFMTCLPVGACCLNAGRGPLGAICEILTQSACSLSDGTYQGDDTTCDNDPCNPPTGACCYFDGETLTCTEYFEIVCDALNGSYQGDNTICITGTCDSVSGACCLEFGGCIVMPESSCLAIQGVFNGTGTNCTESCIPVGACCFGAFCSDDISQQTCEVEGGTYKGDDSICDNVDCELRACCLFNDMCMDLTQTSCNFMKGNSLPEGTSCDNVTCGDSIVADIVANRSWIYENIPSMLNPPTNCRIDVSALITNDPLNNSSYAFSWTTFKPFDSASTAFFSLVSVDGTSDATFRAPNRPGYSPAGLSHYVEVMVWGNDHGNFGYALIPIQVRLLGDVNDSGCTDAADRQLITDVIDSEVTDPDVILAADVNCDGSVNALDSQTALFVELNSDGQGACIPD